MDKKKVKDKLDKIQRTLDSLRGYNDRINKLVLVLDDCVKSAQEELSKSDWISVEDRLPRLGVSVNVCNKDNIDDVWITFRTTNQHVVAISELDFAIEYGHMEITHWKPIEKLEE